MLSRRDLIVELMRAYPRQPFTEDNFRAYQAALADVPPELLEPAVRALIRETKWLPTIAEIRERVAELALRLPREPEALQQIEERMRWGRESATTRGDPPDVHPLVREALDRVGGWHSFHIAEEATVIRGQFGRLYRELRTEAIHAAQVADGPAAG